MRDDPPPPPTSFHHAQRLLEERLTDRVPAILLTGKGVPDLATRWVGCGDKRGPGHPRACPPRAPAQLPPPPSPPLRGGCCTRRALAHALLTAFPHLLPVGLVDWNPWGVHILRVFKYGSARMGGEAPRYALPHLTWLGARSGWLELAAGGEFQARRRGVGRQGGGSMSGQSSSALPPPVSERAGAKCACAPARPPSPTPHHTHARRS